MPEVSETSVAEALVTRITIQVETSRQTFEVEHGPDDLNIPDESFPKRMRVVGDADDGWVPLGVLNGNRSVLARANALIERDTRRRVPRQDTAPSPNGASFVRAAVRVETEDEDVYRVQVDTTDLDLPISDCTYHPVNGEAEDIETIPEAVRTHARHAVQTSVDL